MVSTVKSCPTFCVSLGSFSSVVYDMALTTRHESIVVPLAPLTGLYFSQHCMKPIGPLKHNLYIFSRCESPPGQAPLSADKYSQIRWRTYAQAAQKSIAIPITKSIASNQFQDHHKRSTSTVSRATTTLEAAPLGSISGTGQRGLHPSRPFRRYRVSRYPHVYHPTWRPTHAPRILRTSI